MAGSHSGIDRTLSGSGRTTNGIARTIAGMDRQSLEQFSDTNPPFYADYTNARKLTDEHGGGKKAPPAKPTP